MFQQPIILLIYYTIWPFDKFILDLQRQCVNKKINLNLYNLNLQTQTFLLKENSMRPQIHTKKVFTTAFERKLEQDTLYLPISILLKRQYEDIIYQKTYLLLFVRGFQPL